MKVKIGSYTTKYVGTAQAEETFCENEHVTTGSQITLHVNNLWGPESKSYKLSDKRLAT